ncbi:TonB-dependent receptor [Phenylobacterium sp.]|uniref:TonB-dependent receptor n=1 Tax=Phenylobacterium sp. TaxID=1871053 RepID=UPI0025E30E25|nr:TonB-dependent receptor [Phenylobacterium sp.]MBX3484708.1 TonB-dependent receptor [Phenylobacterium sp.]MCW5760157.1 TonB-dependent receptor [Phenylobacterium sp.]
MRAQFVALMAGCSLAAMASAACAADETTVNELVVTAAKRTERLQDVPVAVTVVGENQMAQQGITSAVDLSRAVPALSTGVDQLRIRGIGTFSFARTSEASVGFILDGVSLANAGPVAPQLFDVARVEVLPGPQGTLFGRNASAGVINLVSNAPDPGAFAGSAHVEVGERASRTAQLMSNLPLGADAALRLTASYVRKPQRIHNLPNDSWNNEEATNGRARLLWRPSQDVTVNLIGDYSRVLNKGGNLFSVYLATPGSTLSAQLAACGVTVSRDNNETCIGGGNNSKSEAWGVSGQADWTLGDLTLTSLTAFRGYDQAGGGDADSTLLNILDLNGGTARVRNFSQELRITSPSGGRLEYVAGLYYFNSNQDYTGEQAGGLGLLPAPLTLGQDFATEARSRSYAAFGQATLHATDDLRIIAGLRLNREELRASTTRVVHPGALNAFGSLLPIQGSARDDSVSYRLGAQYDVSDAAMAYLTYNRGYKGPAINDQAASPTLPLIIRPEVPKAWELGLKSELLDGRIALNLAAFRTRITDFQTQYYNPQLPGYVFGNAPSLTTKGVQADLFGRVSDDLSVTLGAIYTDASYGKGYLVACSQRQTAAQGCFPVTGGTAQDAAGTRLSGVPKFKATGSFDYRARLTDGLEGFVQGDLVYTTRIYYGQGFDPLNSTGKHLVVGGRIGARTTDGRFGGAIYVRNLFDERAPYLTLAQPLAGQLGETNGFVQSFGPEAFRVIGVSLDARF